MIIQVKFVKNRSFFFASDNKCSQIVDVSRICCCVIEKLDLDDKFIRINRDVVKSISCVRFICQNLSLFFSYLLLILISIINCDFACRMIIVHSNTQIIVYNNVVLFVADFFCFSMIQKNMNRNRVDVCLISFTRFFNSMSSRKVKTRRSTTSKFSFSNNAFSTKMISRLSMMSCSITSSITSRNHFKFCDNLKTLLVLFFLSHAIKIAKTL
jgi:hypothetical protein